MSAPTVTDGDIAANIVGEYYFTAAEGVAGVQGLMHARARGLTHEHADELAPLVVVKAHPRLRDVTFCVLVLRNAFVVVGHSVPVSPENFDAAAGRKYARAAAVDKCGELMAYELRTKLHAETPRTPIWPDVTPALVSDMGLGSVAGAGKVAVPIPTTNMVSHPTPAPNPPEPAPEPPK